MSVENAIVIIAHNAEHLHFDLDAHLFHMQRILSDRAEPELLRAHRPSPASSLSLSALDTCAASKRCPQHERCSAASIVHSTLATRRTFKALARIKPKLACASASHTKLATNAAHRARGRIVEQAHAHRDLSTVRGSDTSASTREIEESPS